MRVVLVCPACNDEYLDFYNDEEEEQIFVCGFCEKEFKREEAGLSIQG